VDILRDKPRRQAMAQAARQAAKDRFCSDAILQHYVAEYEKAIDAARRSVAAR
jgi:hypothetical protein